MSFLERVKKVIVMEITDRDEVMERTPGSDMAGHLARHGVAVETSHTVKDEIGIGDRLLSAAVDPDADLMVVGAYGHSRLREYALGGVTRCLLDHLTVPMLFSR